MDYNTNDTDSFFHQLALIKKELPKENITKSFISVGSSFFINFGPSKEELLVNGRIYKRSEWAIGIENASWRLSKGNKYIVGSSDPFDQMDLSVKRLIKEKFISWEVISQFMDMQFNFSNGYQLTTFFNYYSEFQWTLFFPNEDSVSVNCGTQEELLQAISLSKKFNINDNYKAIELPNSLKKVTNLSFKKDLILSFENNVFLNLNNCIWRLEKDGLYQIGYMDQLDDKQKVVNQLNQLVDLKLLRATFTPSFFDAQF